MDGLAVVAEVLRFERHPDLYLDDGDVVLRAHISSEGRILKYQLFCVRKAILSAHSHVFANLFADTSEDVGPAYDGKPLISMGDEATEVSHLLLYLYDPSCVPESLLYEAYADPERPWIAGTSCERRTQTPRWSSSGQLGSRTST